MSWADAVPNLLIGLREGLEAGLVVSLLLAALRKADAARPDGARRSSAPVWLGVLGAVAVSGSFAAVLTFSTSVLSSRAQEAVGGILSVLAVGLVTAMIFWMRATAAGLSGELRGRVDAALRIGAGALTLTAFLAVGREGLETTLFLWTAVRASGETVAPLLGAAVGLAIAVALCALLYRRAIRINLGVFFGRTALALIVIAAGVLSYGLGDLQDAGLLAGRNWVAFDISGTVAADSWWASIISGVTDLAPRMTVLQVVAWLAYLAVVMPVFVRAGRSPAAPPEPAAPEPAAPEPAAPAAALLGGGAGADGGRWARLAGRRPWPVAAALVAVPVAVAGLTIVALPSAASGASTRLTVTGSRCAPEWTSGHSGAQTFTVDNRSGQAGEINLDNSSGAVVAEIETIGPATTATMAVTLGRGSYSVACLMSGQPTRHSRVVDIAGAAAGPAPAAVTPVTLAELTPANDAYQRYAAGELATLTTQVAAIRADLARADLAGARSGWLAAQLTWERVAASYDSFGAAGLAVDGLPEGLPGGVRDPRFTGLHRLEYGLFHGQSAATLRPVAERLAADVGTVVRTLRSDDIAGDPTNLPIRTHEVLEDALRDHLSGLDDEGGGAAYPETYADAQVTRVLLGDLAPLIDARSPRLVATIRGQLGGLSAALVGTRSDGRWRSPASTPLAARQRVDAALGTVLETLAAVPDLLEVPPTH